MASREMDIVIDAVTGLGTTVDPLDGSKSIYHKGQHCLGWTLFLKSFLTTLFPNYSFGTSECLKDLQRLLRRDDPHTRDVFHVLGEWNVVKANLIPLILSEKGDELLVLNAGETDVV